MSPLWNFYRLVCVILVTLVILALLVLGIDRMLTSPAADMAAPQGRFKLQVFTAGQGSVPPDYRSDARFYLYDGSRPPLLRRVLVASAPFADGWNVAWSGPRDVTIALGALSFVGFSRAHVDGINVHVTIAAGSPGETACVVQSFDDTIDGINCFDRLLAARHATR